MILSEPNGKMQTGGWFKLDDSWYYIQSNGARRFSELSEIGGKKYLFAADGKDANRTSSL